LAAEHSNCGGHVLERLLTTLGSDYYVTQFIVMPFRRRGRVGGRGLRDGHDGNEHGTCYQRGFHCFRKHCHLPLLLWHAQSVRKSAI
jgi:hypothetical protein